MSNPEFHQCPACGYEWKCGQRGKHNCANTLNAHYEALREKNEELQRQLDEAAKQGPIFFGDDEMIAEWRKGSRRGGAVDIRIISTSAGMCTTPLYAIPPNLPALIEQAKREEREQIGQLIHYPECWDTSAYPTLEAALLEIHHCSQCYENRDAAIRARSGK